MHPDEAVQIAIQALRPRSRHPAPQVARAPSRFAAAALLRASFGALRGRARAGRTPDEAADAALAPLGVEVGR